MKKRRGPSPLDTFNQRGPKRCAPRKYPYSYPCLECRRSFGTFAYLRDHIARDHPNVSLPPYNETSDKAHRKLLPERPINKPKSKRYKHTGPSAKWQPKLKYTHAATNRCLGAIRCWRLEAVSHMNAHCLAYFNNV